MLVLLLLLPLIGALLTYPMGNRASRWFTIIVCLVEVYLVGSAVRHGAPEVNLPWLESLGIGFQLKLTGQNVLMLLLCPLLAGCAAVATSERTERLAEYSGHLMLLLGALQGVFLANNLGLFYIFFELMLLPTLLLVSRWGGANGQKAALKFLLYTLAGSLPMLLAVVSLAFRGGVPDLSYEALSHLSPEAQSGLFGLFFLAFAVKIPIFPLHGWVVDLYESAPASVTAVIAGAMSKAGLYGLLRICVGMLPDATRFHADSLIWLAFLSMVYGALCALGAPRVRGILAYSSLSHLALMTMGVLAGNSAGSQGAVLQMFAHGLCVGGLFLLLALLESRGAAGDLESLGGMHKAFPRITAIALVLTMAALGCPGLASFPGELSLLLGIYQHSDRLGLLSCFSVVMSAWYLLRFFQGAMLGPTKEKYSQLSDLGFAEAMSLAPLVVLVFAMGFIPQQFLLWVRILPWT